ncbi:MAG: hypothetical protein RLZZ31_541 [Actinomycetota bacterium]|jgi:quinol monooxygenase YgiN
MSQTSLFVKLTLQPSKRDEVFAALEEMLPTVEQEEGTLVYSFHRDAGDENVIWIFELYSDGDALQAHSSSPALGELFGKIGPHFADAPLMVMATPGARGKGLPKNS